nr:prolyl aminopeptidase [Rhodospirillales bacterium]
MDTPHKPDLYPPLKPYGEGYLDVSDGHRLYYELSGNPQGIPVVYLHGGPGAGCMPAQRRYFNPDRYLIVLFDQRGSGRSTPFASTRHNTTQDLVADIESLRQHLGIDQWLVAGGSWGSTLALAYGTTHAPHCLGFLLRGVFLGADSEIEWFLDGMGKIFPEAYSDFSAHVGGLAGRALFEAYLERLSDDDPNRHLPAARAWARYESRCSTLRPLNGGSDDGETSATFNAYALSLARLEAHYFQHHCFLRPNELLDRLETVRHLPAHIVQGRYDIVCPMETAYRLHLAWPDSQLHVVPDAGHSGMEPGIARALTQGADSLAEQLAQLLARPV